MKALEMKHENEAEMERRTVSNLRQELSQAEERQRDGEKQVRQLQDEVQQKQRHSREAQSTKTMELESALRSTESELSRVKEEFASMASRAASALQQAKVSTAEADALRAETSSIVSDGHTSHAALMQALQRLQQLETELARTRAEKDVLQQDADKQYAELRKFQEVSASKDGKTQLSALELKRAKTHFEVRHSVITASTPCSSTYCRLWYSSIMLY